MDTVAKYLKLRFFAEGIELPVISASVQMTINFPAVAAINVVPTDGADDLKPGTMVHLFFYDFFKEGPIDVDDFKNYSLFFSGEVTGISFTWSPIGRSAVLQCADSSNSWQRCYQYMITYGPNGNFVTPAAKNYAAGSGILNNIIDGHLAVLAGYLNSRPKTIGLQNIKGLVGGIITLIEQFGGIVGHSRGVNDFFTYEELRNKTMQQIAAEEDDKTATQLFDAKEFYEWLENGLVSLGELCTLWDMIRLLFQYIYYESSPNCCAYFNKGTDNTDLLDTEKINNALTEISKSLYDNKDMTDIRLRCMSAIGNLNTLLLYPALDEDQKKNIGIATDKLQGIINSFLYSKNITKLLSGAKSYVNKSIDKITKKDLNNIRLDRLSTIIIKPECYFVSPPRCNVLFPEMNTQISYSRSFTQEYTRLRLQSGMVFDIDKDALLADFSYAPSGPTVRKYAKDHGFDNTISAVLPWERYTGILPKFEYVQEINYVSNKKAKEEQKNVQQFAKSYKQRAANFNFYKYRFMARSMTGSCRFNPLLVPGFPLVVIKEPFIIDRDILINIAKQRGTDIDEITSQDIINNMKNFAKELKAPKQFIGYATNITHMIDQNGTTTSFTCSHARPHRITDDDFLIILDDASVEGGLTTVTKKTVLDLESIQKNQDTNSLKYLIDLTPQTPPPTTNPAVINETKPKLTVSGFDVFNISLRPQQDSSPPNDYIGSTQEAEIEGGTVKVPKSFGNLHIGSQGKIGTISAIRVVNDLIKKITINGKESYAWSTIIVYEDKKEKPTKSIPIESVLRPSWYSYLYSNLHIGKKIYGNFFGCGAVVDELVYSSPEGLSIQGSGSPNEILDKLNDSDDLLSDAKQLENKNLADAPSVESALDILAFQYGEAIRQGLNVNKFVNDYTYRPIATMEDILGSPDLEIDFSGNKAVVKQGRLGFHSIAISGQTDLKGLLNDPSIPLDNRRGKKTLPKSIDVRKERKEAVKNYQDELKINDREIIGLKG